ncbi:hypothetical protein ACX93W_22570 [Paenibacillus sp. CAU 1782]
MKTPWIEIAIGVFVLASFLFITLPLVVRSLKQVGREEREAAKALLEDGISSRATVVSITPTDVQLDEQPVVLLELDVRLPYGGVERVTVRTAIPVAKVPLYQRGCEIEVKYKEMPEGLRVAVEGAYLP